MKTVPVEPAAWITEDGERVVTARTMNGAIKDGGAILSSLKAYSVPLYLAAPSPWVKVSERVPERQDGDEYTLVWSHLDGVVDESYYHHSTGAWISAEGCTQPRPTHWQPYHTPAAPEEGQ